MSGSQLGTYQPPSFEERKPKEQTKQEGDDFNLLDIDFEDINDTSHQAPSESNNSSRLDASDAEIKEELPNIPEDGFLDSKAPSHKKVYEGYDDDINANLVEEERKATAQGFKDDNDLEENKANIVQQPAGWHKYLTVDYYKQYFDVTTEEVITRLSKACAPLYQGTIFENGKVDLYGPLWIIITLNVAITIFGNMARFVKFETSDDNKKYISEVDSLAKSAPLITMYFIAMPAFLSILIKISGSEQISKLTFKILSIYGYSFTSFIPATLLYIIPFNSFKWLVLLGAAAISLYFLSKELMLMIRNSLDESKIKLAAGVM